MLKAGALLADGSAVQLELVLASGEFEGDSCVQLIVPAHKRDEREIASELADAVNQDPATGLWVRRHLFKLCASRLATPPAGGVRCFALLQPDKFEQLSREIGVLSAEDFLTGFATLVRAMLGPNDIAGHFGASNILVLLERGNARDAEAWCESLVERVAKHIFQIGELSLKSTCSAGLALVPSSDSDMNGVIRESIEAARRTIDRGGNQVISSERADHDTRVLAYDQVWVKHIRSALADNRFHLVQMPIASLGGDNRKVFDVAVRMLDLQAREVLPSEFLPAAERNDLMRAIDRWVLGAALAVISRRQVDMLFVRLSKDSVVDGTLMAWFDTQLKASHADPERLCIQVTEDVASRHLQHMQRLLGELRQRKLRLALEHFGAGRDSQGLMSALPVDYVKIDGSLMQGLTGSPEAQQRVRNIVLAATERGIETVAERIEDANTMAVVWQLGVHHIQGFLVHAPEEIVLKS